jgi:hypothetical protein
MGNIFTKEKNYKETPISINDYVINRNRNNDIEYNNEQNKKNLDLVRKLSKLF